MIRIVKLTGKYYGYDMSNESEDDIISSINDFVLQGTPVLIVEYLEDAADFNIYEQDIEMIQPE